jgi:hypothetical protein
MQVPLKQNGMNKCQLKLKMHGSKNGMKLRKVHIPLPLPPSNYHPINNIPQTTKN